MGADQFPLPHLGAQARILLDRIVASGAAGVHRRETDDWVLSCLIELRYVEASTIDDTTFVCTAAGRHRWQIEVLADEERAATALRRQLIRHRLDKRFVSLGIDTSTALTTACSPAEPLPYRSVSVPWSPPRQANIRFSPVLAAMFAATSVALLVTIASTEPEGVRGLFYPPKSHVAAASADQLKGNARESVQVGTHTAAPVTAPVDPRTHEGFGHTANTADATSANTQRPGSIPEKDISAPNSTLAQVEEAGRTAPAVVDAASPDDGTIVNWAATAAALIGAALNESGLVAADLMASIERSFSSTAAALVESAANESGQITGDATASVQRSVRSIAAVLPHALAVTARTVFVRDAVAPAALQPAVALNTVTDGTQAAIVQAVSSERPTAKGPVARSKTNVDPQHAIVERLNRISLAAARRGEAWRPNRRGEVAEAR